MARETISNIEVSKDKLDGKKNKFKLISLRKRLVCIFLALCVSDLALNYCFSSFVFRNC